MKNMIRSITRLLKSLRLTIILIICLSAVFFLGLIIPQEDLFSSEQYLDWKTRKTDLVSFLEFFGLTDVYKSPLTLGLWGLFFLNLVVVMLSRIPSLWRRCTKVDMPSETASLKAMKQYEVIDGRGIDDARSVLKAMRYSFYPEADHFYAVKNRFSPFGTIIFHLSFLLLLVGGVITFYTKFRAEAVVAVNETFSGRYAVLRYPKYGDVPRTTFTVKEVKPTYYHKSVPVDLTVVLSTKEGDKVIGINRPYKTGTLSFVVTDLGVSPLFIIRGTDGRELDAAVLKLKVLNGETDTFEMMGYTFETFFYPDHASETQTDAGDTSLEAMSKKAPKSQAIIRGGEITDPAFHITVKKDGAVLGKGLMKPRQSIDFDGKKIIFEDLSYWVKFYIGHEYGLWLVYTGFSVIIIVLIVRFVFYRRDIKGIIEGGSLHVAGRAEYFPALFSDEFAEIAEQIRKRH